MKTRISTAMRSLWIVALLFVAQSAQAQDFEGRITHTLEIAMLGGEKIEAIANVKGNKVMLETDMGPMGSLRIFSQDVSKNVVVVTNGAGFEVDLAGNGTAKNVVDAPMPKPTGKTQTINGYATEEWAMELGEGQVASLWLTKDIDKTTANAIKTAMKALASTQPDNDPGQRERSKMFEDKGLVLVRMSLITQNQPQLTIELQKAEMVKIADSTFEIPAGIKVQKIDPSMLQGGASRQDN